MSGIELTRGRAVYVLKNRESGPDLEPGRAEFLTLDRDGETVETLDMTPGEAERMAERRGLEAIPPGRLLYLWREAERRREALA